MSHTHSKQIPSPGSSGQSQTMFYVEGNPTAVLVINRAGRRHQTAMEFPRAEAALDWCRHHSTTFVYSPVDLVKN